jgi:ADP-ribose pyrophosphatase
MEQCTFSKRIYEGKVVNLRVDNVLLDGKQNATREVVEHRGAAVIVPILDRDQVVFVRQYRYPIGTELLEIPAGTLNDGESPEGCARRELEEETGYSSEDIVKMFECYVAPGYSTEKLHFYLARKLTKTQQNPDEDERLIVETISLSNVMEKIRSGEICDAKSICAIFRTSDFIKHQ